MVRMAFVARNPLLCITNARQQEIEKGKTNKPAFAINVPSRVQYLRVLRVPFSVHRLGLARVAGSYLLLYCREISVGCHCAQKQKTFSPQSHSFSSHCGRCILCDGMLRERLIVPKAHSL